MLRNVHITITAVLSMAVIVLFFLLQKSCNDVDKGKNFESMYNASQDSLHHKINKDGTETVSTALLYGSVENLMKLHASDSSALGKLQKLVDKFTISAAVFSTSTSGHSSSGTIITGHDTVRKDSLVYIYPEYTLKRDSGKWADISARANKDSFNVNYSVFNDFLFKQDFEKRGRGFQKFISQRKPIVSVTDLNPHTKTRELQSFAVKPKKYSRLKHFVEGAVIGATSIYVITH